MIRQLGSIKSLDAFRAYLAVLGTAPPLDDVVLSAREGSPMAHPIRIGPVTVGNRWAIHPMEGWDGTEDGQPTEPTLRRWSRFGLSGAKLIWGGEAFAVRRDGRANPHQLYYTPGDSRGLRRLVETLTDAHRERFGATDDLLIGLQLTHSGRYSRPSAQDRPEPLRACRHAALDARIGGGAPIIEDAQVEALIDDYTAAARAAAVAGFRFVDVKACHGYLMHEFLSAYDRPGRYGGDFEGRTRPLREIIARIRDEVPALLIGVRLSLFDTPPFPIQGPVVHRGYPGFGCVRDDPFQMDLTEPIRLLRLLHESLGVAMVNLSAGSPYTNPHIQRPAFHPPSDGYPPPEDPILGCVRQMQAVRAVKHALPGLPVVGTAYSYFQQFLPNVAQAAIREGWTDFVGLGRSTLAYWDLPADVLDGRGLQTKRFCRTFSDCTTAPRHGLPSGCYPLDDAYRRSPEARGLKEAKAQLRLPARV